MAKIGQQKWYHLRNFHLKAPLNPLKLNPLLASGIVKRGLKWYHFKESQNFAYKNGTILEKAQNSSTKMYHLRIFHSVPLNPLKLNPLLSSGINKKGVENGTISKKVKISLKMVPY